MSRRHGELQKAVESQRKALKDASHLLFLSVTLKAFKSYMERASNAAQHRYANDLHVAKLVKQRDVIQERFSCDEQWGQLFSASPSTSLKVAMRSAQRDRDKSESGGFVDGSVTRP